jgi:hypothetical protein
VPVDASLILKTMPPRGPFQQYRLHRSLPFMCSRCGSQKVSKLHTVIHGGEQDALLCNGCYGRLVDLWDIKQGSLPEDERDDAILALLSAAVPVADIEAAQRRLVADARHRRLTPAAQQMLATVDAVTVTLRAATGLDWSAAVIGLCKAVEVEVVRRVAEPLRAETADLDLQADLADKDLARLAKFCVGRAPAPELGSIAYTLQVAAKSRSRAANSPLLQALRRLATGWQDGKWVLSASGLSATVGTLARDYRNPAAHTAVLTEADYMSCRDLVQGERGVLSRLMAATTPA